MPAEPTYDPHEGAARQLPPDESPLPDDQNGKSKGLDLVNGPVFSTTVRLAVPVILSHFLNLALGIADMIMVGKLGKESIAALVISNSLLMMLFAIGWGASFAVITLVSQHTGAQRHGMARRSASHAIMFAGALGLVMMFVGNLFLPDLIGIYNSEPEVARFAVSYSDLIFDFMPFYFMIFLGAAIMQGLGDTITPLIIMGCINAINILINYVLIFGMWGFPRLGIIGAATGSVIARGLGSVALIIILVSGAYRMVLRGSDFRPSLREFWSILRLGIPNSLQSLLRNINVMFLYRLLSLTYLPTVAQASLGIGFHAEALSFIPLIGLFIATGTMVGQNLGAGKPERAEQASWAALKTGLILMSVSCVIFLTIPEKIVAIFNDDPSVIFSGSWYLRINAITQLFQASIVLIGTLRGAGDSISPLKAAFIGQWVLRLPIAWFLSTQTGLQEWGVWLAMATSSAIECSIYFWMFRQGHWKKMRVAIDSD